MYSFFSIYLNCCKAKFVRGDEVLCGVVGNVCALVGLFVQ